MRIETHFLEDSRATYMKYFNVHIFGPMIPKFWKFNPKNEEDYMSKNVCHSSVYDLFIYRGK